jgi:hypothetical protein
MTETAIELAIHNEDFLTAARWCENHRTGLLSGDALHLAVAHRSGALLRTLDRRLHDAAQVLGVKAELV